MYRQLNMSERIYKVDSLHTLPITTSSRGVYTLLIHVSSSKNVKVGRLGSYNFPTGYYAYTGSALGVKAQGLLKRISQHLIKDKRSRWHIDYLLKEPDVAIERIIFSETWKRKECIIARALEKNPNVRVLVKGFGASDCKQGCGSHLHQFLNINLEEASNTVLEIHKKACLNPHLIPL